MFSLACAIVIYIAISLAIHRGQFIAVHYFSYDNLMECKEHGALVSNELQIRVQGDSLQNDNELRKKFYLSKSVYEKFYGFLFHTVNEDKGYRRLKWKMSQERH